MFPLDTRGQWLIPVNIVAFRDCQREVGAETEAAAGREADHLPGGGVYPPDSPTRGHARVLGLGGEHVLENRLGHYFRSLDLLASTRSH